MFTKLHKLMCLEDYTVANGNEGDPGAGCLHDKILSLNTEIQAIE